MLVFSFNWPSVAYVIDILAWDFFFALSMLTLSVIQKENFVVIYCTIEPAILIFDVSGRIKFTKPSLMNSDRNG